MTGSPARAFVAELPHRIARLAEGVELLDPMDAPPLRWGILGAGHIARRFAEEVPAHTRSTIAAVAARDLSRAETFASEFGVGRAHGSYADLIADPAVDAIYVATINSTHHDLALACIRAGKPVLVEKPFTLNAAQARDVFTAAEDHAVLVVDGMWTRFLPQFTVARQIAANGKLGRLVTAHASFAGVMREPIPRIVEADQGGGALLDIGVYAVGMDDAVTIDWDATVPGGFQFEAAEIARLLAVGATQSTVMPWRASSDVMEVLDLARDAIGGRTSSRPTPPTAVPVR